MKRELAFCVVWLFAGKISAQDPISVIIQQGIKKVIVAVDLKIQRQQNEVIWLQNAQKVIENALSKLRLGEIGDWVEKQRSLYQGYFDELWRVKDAVSTYYKVKDIASLQLRLVSEYKRAWNGAKQDRHFTPDEVVYMGKVYSGILQESIQNLERVVSVLQAFSLQMGDAGRLTLVNAAADAMQQNLSDLRAFSQQNVQLSLQRARNSREIAAIRELYGIREVINQ